MSKEIKKEDSKEESFEYDFITWFRSEFIDDPSAFRSGTVKNKP